MAQVVFKNINKDYSGIHAVRDLNLTIMDKEFLVIVGPSGSGKTTTLRMLAGLENPTSGEIYIDEENITSISPEDRDISMVFQSYSVYPHLTVRDNLELGLRNKELSYFDRYFKMFFHSLIYLSCSIVMVLVSWLISLILPVHFRSMTIGFFSVFYIMLIMFPHQRFRVNQQILFFLSKFDRSLRSFIAKEEKIQEQIIWISKLLGINSFLSRKPGQLSGGQRQRVALGRAIIRKPKVLLMDEPLSNLDAKLRNSMRREIAKLHHKLGVTTVFVTHDQIEAMTLGQRIAVMNNGMIEQVGSPKEIYSEPMNRFVASFIGNPPMNFINASCWPNEKKGVIIELKNGFRMEYLDKSEASKFDKYINREILLGIRSEHIAIQIQPPVLHRSERDTLNLNIMKGIITLIEPIGSSYQIALDVGLDEDLIVSANSEVELTIGMKVYLEFSTRHLHFFDATTEKRIQI